MKGVLSLVVRKARRAGKRDFYPALAALVSPVQNIYFPHRTHFHYMCSLNFPIAQQLEQAVLPCRLFLNICLWSLFICMVCKGTE
jgi:hypothetical protein